MGVSKWTGCLVGFGAAMSMLAGGAFAQAGEGERWGARDPVKLCPEITSAGAPDAGAVVALFRCARESITAQDELWLVEDVAVQIGAARPFQGRLELMSMPDADTSKAVHSLRGSWTWVTCRDPKALRLYGGDPARNCSRARVERAEGACWMTTFGSWRCNMTGAAAPATQGHAPPR